MKEYAKYAKLLFSKKNAMPVYLVHFITNRCNARCAHCFVDLDDVEGELSLKEIGGVIRSVGENIYNVNIAGGEPFLRKDLFDIVDGYFTHSCARNIQIPTNGSMTEDIVATANKILRKHPNKHLGMNLSIDGIGEDHDRSRGVPGMFEKVIATYRKLSELEKQYDNLNLNVNVTVSAYNQDKLGEIYEFLVEELKVKNVLNSLVRGNPKDQSARNVDLEKYKAFNRIIEKGMKEKRLRGYSKFLFSDIVNAQNIVKRKTVEKVAEEARYVQPCYAGLLSGVIRSNGDVYPCELLNMEMGNVRDHDCDLRKLWLSPGADQVREHIQKTRCYCTHECFLTCNTLFNPLALPKVLKEYVLLKLS